jgi:hypothetical protein
MFRQFFFCTKFIFILLLFLLLFVYIIILFILFKNLSGYHSFLEALILNCTRKENYEEIFPVVHRAFVFRNSEMMIEHIMRTINLVGRTTLQ